MSADITAVTNQSSTTDGATALAGIKTALTNVVTDVDLKAPLISPSFTTPTLGVATATSINKLTLTQPTNGSTLTIDDGFTLRATGNVTALSGSHTGTSSGTNTGDQTISDATITTTDITTNDVSTSKHGFAPKAPNDATKFLNGVGAYAVPAAGGLYGFGQTSRTAATGTGTQNIAHGLGKTPTLIKIFAVMDGGSSGAGVATGFSEGTGTASNNTCTWSTKSRSTSSSFSGQSSLIIRGVGNDGSTALVEAVISALDATNITLNFTTLSGTGVTSYIQWEAFG